MKNMCINITMKFHMVYAGCNQGGIEKECPMAIVQESPDDEVFDPRILGPCKCVKGTCDKPPFYHVVEE